jgi:hypothetical protein
VQQLAIHSRNANAPHEAGHTPPPNGMTILSEEIAQHPSPSKGILEVQLVNPAHQGPLAIGHGRQLIVCCRTRHAEQLALPNNRQRMSSIDLRVQRLITFDSRQSHLHLECCSMIPSRSFHCLAPLVRHHLVAFVKPGSHLPYCQNFWSPLYSRLA